MKVLDTIGNQVMVALERARLHQHLENLVTQRTAALQAEVIERCRAEEKVVSLNRIYAMLSGINTLIIRVHEREELFCESCRIAVEFGRFGLAWIGLVDAESYRVKLAAWHGTEQWTGSQGLTAEDFGSLDNALVGEVLRQGRPVIYPDLKNTPSMPVTSISSLRGYRALCILPLLVN